MQDYHQLDIWNRAMDYAVAVYELYLNRRNTTWPHNSGGLRHRYL